MERLLFSKIETWVVLLLAILGVTGALVFAALVLTAERSRLPRGSVATTLIATAEVPLTFARMLKPDLSMAAPLARDLKGAGWSFDPEAAADLDGYLLLSRYDGDRERHVVELRALPGGEVLHEWLPDADSLLEGMDSSSHIADATGWTTRRYRVIHPFMFSNGDLLIKDHQSPLFRINPCGGRVWKLTGRLFHHSTEPDGEGGFWIPSYEDPSPIPAIGADFHDNSLAHVSADGSLISATSLAQTFIEADNFAMIFTAGNYNSDPLHLNDIQPVPGDGPYWKAGDLFLSLRHQSLVVLYRPSTGKILWMKRGPWLAQHDVDVLDDHRIAVFDNNAYDKGRGGYVQGASDIMIYDFATGQTETPYHAAMARNKVVTLNEGLFSLLPGGYLMVEQENAGRELIMTPKGEIAADFVNRAQDERVYRLGWSRYIDKNLGDAALEAMKGISCAD